MGDEINTEQQRMGDPQLLRRTLRAVVVLTQFPPTTPTDYYFGKNLVLDAMVGQRSWEHGNSCGLSGQEEGLEKEIGKHLDQLVEMGLLQRAVLYLPPNWQWRKEHDAGYRANLEKREAINEFLKPGS